MTFSCSPLGAKQWLSGRPSPSSLLSGNAAVEVRSAGPGRGVGLFASRAISHFCQILVDAPLIVMAPGDDLPELYQRFTGLSEQDKQTYLSLSYHRNAARDALLKDKLLRRGFGEAGLNEMALVAGIMQTNAFNVDMGHTVGSAHRALFPTIARINHSCEPNAHVCFYPPSETGKSGYMIVHSLKSLVPGEEIMISYFNILLPIEERKRKMVNWGFECCCTRCVEGHGESQVKAFREFTARQSSVMQSTRTNIRDIRGACEQARGLLSQNEEMSFVFPAFPDVFDSIAMLEAKTLVVQKLENQRGRAVAALELAAIWEARITGPKSPATAKRLSKVAQFAATTQQGQQRPRITGTASYAVEWADG